MDALKKKRGTCKGSLTRLENTVDGYDAENLNPKLIESHTKRLELLWIEIQAMHQAMLELCTDEAEEAPHVQEFDEMEKRYYEIEAKLCDAALKASKRLVLTPPPHPHRPVETASSSAFVNLPKANLPTFAGESQDWPTFRDLFTTMVHEQAGLSNIQKFQYLMTQLKGDAARTLQNVAITEDGYQDAWDSLVARYDDEKKIIMSTMDKLMEQPSMKYRCANELRSLIDTTNQAIRGLKRMKQPVDRWDVVLVHTMSRKLDSETHERWQSSLKDKKMPSFNSMLDQLEQQLSGLDVITKSKSKPQNTHHNNGKAVEVKKVHHSAPNNCVLCDDSHIIIRCQQFLDKSVSDRWVVVKEKKLCLNCLRVGHFVSQCTSSSCRVCKKKHHSLLHNEEDKDEAPKNVMSHHTNNTNGVLLATAIVNVKDSKGNAHLCRVLLDGGSESSFLREGFAKSMGIKLKSTDIVIGGIGSADFVTSKYKADVSFFPAFESNDSILAECYVLKKVTSDLPSIPCDQIYWSHLANLRLADPTFHTPGKIDALLGSDILTDILHGQIIKSEGKGPSAQNTIFGWVVFGPVVSKYTRNCVHSHVVIHDLNEVVSRFWEMEGISEVRSHTKEERDCEAHFSKTVIRDETGKYMVKLPFKCEPATALGDSFVAARRRFIQIEKRLQGNFSLKEKYQDFMKEYIESGHMEEVPSEEVQKPAGSTYYLPHHSVLKEASTTTKLRVVFDASAKSASGKSLNDILMVGPVIQDDLFTILVRYRTYCVPLVADLKQMFRQIWVDPSHRDFLRILWRKEPNELLREYRLKTVTYGTACAPYQATRVLRQLAEDEQISFPLAAAAIKSNMYVDDYMGGAATVKDALKLQSEILGLMQKGKLVLRKWSSSYSQLLESLAPSLRETQLPLKIEEDDSIKTLGLEWHPATDDFRFSAKPFELTHPTKRQILSDIAKVFDPLNLLAPLTIRAKIFMQELWSTKLSWDDKLEPEMLVKWLEYRQDLSTIQKLKVPRYVLSDRALSIELHGFSDSSSKAFAAAVYVRTVSNTGVSCNLVTAKTKVAPRKTISIPRLELCGAVLVAKLIASVKTAFPYTVAQTVCWTDSTVTLDWIRAHPQRWSTFVANRVTTIQELVPPENWYHIDTKQNPADLPSRGVSASDLQLSSLWWHGPEFMLREDFQLKYFPQETCEMALKEERKVTRVHTVVKEDIFLLRFSSLTKLKWQTVVLIRFYRWLVNKHDAVFARPIESEELQAAVTKWVKHEQSVFYSQEIQCLVAGSELPSKSEILSLAPFVDHDGLLRVGGRLDRSSFPYNRKHPMLLSRHGHLAKLMVDHIHINQLHGGVQLTLYTLQQNFWIPRGKDFVRSRIHKCITCFRLSPHKNQQLMGQLPPSRLQPGRANLSVGLDFAGPYNLKVMKVKCNKTYKAYLCIFVCFTTRALHLELVSDMTTGGFLASLRRFVSRRGLPKEIYSDNGLNFVGANTELKKVLKAILASPASQIVKDYLKENSIKWNFSPPAAPNFGGLWEAGVKSVKFHLKRVIGNQRLTYEELNTFLVQVESCLNSRPLCPNTADPSEVAALTPGHFLIGGPLNAIPEVDHTTSKENRLTRWQLLQKLTQHFWRRWSNEYLSRLQQRPRWLKQQQNLELEDVVLLKDDLLPPLQWKLGKVIEVFPGTDGMVRVATVKTSDGQFRRPTSKLAKLPFDSPDGNQWNSLLVRPFPSL